MCSSDLDALVKVDYTDIQGRPAAIEAGGLLSICLQHEIDHLNGVLYIDYLESMDELRKVEPEEVTQP